MVAVQASRAPQGSHDSRLMGNDLAMNSWVPWSSDTGHEKGGLVCLGGASSFVLFPLRASQQPALGAWCPVHGTACEK